VIIEALFGGPFGAAMAQAAAAPSLGAAFLCGYQAALRNLVPSLPPDRNVCLCATEEGGAHPRAILSTLKEAGGGWQLDGRKKWVTAADKADLLLVVASTGMEGGKNRLRLALVGARQPGVTLEPMPPTPFVPEISHAEVTFEAVFVGELLEGDGYDRYLKPFRTVEDAHVYAAVLAFLLPRAPRPLAERILAVLATLEKVTIGDPACRELHLMLAGAIAMGRQIADEAELGDELRRDLQLLNVAEKARKARTEAAWSAAEAAAAHPAE
jgi:alkylation response protein AidB-like acyl-CoA dehydrogenase